MDTYYPNRCVELPLRSLRTILFLMLEVYIDDTDTTVAYSGVWELSGSQSFHNSTFHVANSTVNSKATLIFTGISVMVYGVAVNTQSSHTIDGGNPTFPNATRSSSFMFNILLYSSPILPNGQHNLTIDANNLLIDYFVVTPTGNISTPTSAVISTTFTSSTFSGSVSSSDIQSPAISAADSATTRNSIHQKAIIGAVVALAIVTIFSLFCLWLRRRRKKRDKELEPWAYATSIAVWPMPYTPTGNPPQMIEQPSSPANYPMGEPPPYDAADAGHPTMAPVGSSRHLSQCRH